MTDQTAQEPTMEEILASIRRIISEDDAPVDAAPVPAAAAEPSPALMDETPSVQEPAASEDDVLELTDRYEAPAAEVIGDLDVAAPPEEVVAHEPEPAPEPEPEPFPTAWSEPEPAPAPAPVSAPSYDSLVGDSAAASAASAFAGLSAALKKPEPAEIPTGGVGPTIDDLARALLKPMLKEWLDANLPGIVDSAVRKEVERIARNAG